MRTSAWERAQTFAAKLPTNIAWSFIITNEDDGTKGNAAFSVWIDRSQWVHLRLLLGVTTPDECDQQSESWHFDSLTLSFNQPEEQDDAGTAEPGSLWPDRIGQW